MLGSKKKQKNRMKKKLCRFSKENFQGREKFKRFSIDRLKPKRLSIFCNTLEDDACLYLTFI